MYYYKITKDGVAIEVPDIEVEALGAMTYFAATPVFKWWKVPDRLLQLFRCRYPHGRVVEPDHGGTFRVEVYDDCQN